jgi:hypothetical protein
MSEDVNQIGPGRREKLLEGLDRMVESGQVTETEAARLRTAADPDEFENAVRGIRVRHAGAKMDAAVEGGNMTQEEANANLARLEAGEHPRSLRAHLRKLPPRDR